MEKTLVLLKRTLRRDENNATDIKAHLHWWVQGRCFHFDSTFEAIHQ